MMIPLDELIQSFDVKPRGIVHVGAHEGQELSSYLDNKIEKVIWIEANPIIFKTLQERLKNYPHHRSYQFAAFNEDDKTVELNVMENTMCSSILYPQKHLELYPHVPVTEKILVMTKTLNKLFEEENLAPEEYNFLNMDIQGSELLALKGATELLRSLDYIYTEVNDDFFFKDCCLTNELEDFISTWGFERVTRRMHPDGWGDALYKKVS